MARMGEEGQQPGDAEAVGVGDGPRQEWRPPRWGHGLPDAAVVTLERQPNEDMPSVRRRPWWRNDGRCGPGMKRRVVGLTGPGPGCGGGSWRWCCCGTST